MVEFPRTHGAFRADWPVTPGLGLSYEIPFGASNAWYFDWIYQYKSFTQKTPSDEMGTLLREEEII